jgi:HAAS domain-containing protein
MTNATGSESKIDSYLGRVRAALRGLPEREVDDILRELRSHAVELAGEGGAGVETALRSLGDPVDLAKTYRAENRMVQAECTGSTLVILQGLRHANRSWLGRFTVTVVYAFGYAYVLALWVAAVDKLLFPSRTGLWYTPGRIWSLKLVTDGRQPAGANELLGWWLVPVALVAGWLLRYLIDGAARWWIRRYRRSRQTA